MKVLVLSNGELKVREIGNSLEDLQKIVGGYIEIPFLSRKFCDNGIVLEGQFKSKLLSKLLPLLCSL